MNNCRSVEKQFYPRATKVNLPPRLYPSRKKFVREHVEIRDFGFGSFSCYLVLPPFPSDNRPRDLDQYIYISLTLDTLPPPAWTSEQNHPRAEDDWLAVPPDRMRLSLPCFSSESCPFISRPFAFPRARLMRECRGRQTRHIRFHLKGKSYSATIKSCGKISQPPYTKCLDVTST